jgi:putative hydrolase of the HAD superfamily
MSPDVVYPPDAVYPLEFILFDLDGTLYSRDTGLLKEIGHRIQLWICHRLGLTWEEAFAMRRDYFQRYGTTLGGLIAEQEADTHDYLTFVHDIPVETYLEPNPALAAMLAALPLRRVVYTNATAAHSRRVLRALEVDAYFEQIIGIEKVGLRNKLYRDAYERALALLGVQGPECIMVEDSAHNLGPAKALGMTTVLVGTDSATDHAGLSDGSVDFKVESVLEVGQVVQRLLNA